MTIYLDTSAVGMATGTPADPGFRVQADLGRLVGHLLDAGHCVALVGERDHVAQAAAVLPPWSASRVQSLAGDAGSLPEAANGWVVTASSDVCVRARPNRRLRTILVGWQPTSSGHLDRPADVIARSLADAVIGILTKDAMGERPQ